jgi:hypothetical protein
MMRRMTTAVLVLAGVAAWALTGCEMLPPQNGGSCTYGGRTYSECYVGQSWSGDQQRYIGVSDLLILDSEIRNVSGGPCLLLRGVRNVEVANLTVEGCDQSGIRISNQADSFDVRIIGGSITDTGRVAASNGSCINAGDTGGVGHRGLIIDGVQIQDCGFDDLDHGIYLQTPGYVIRNVVVGDVSGNGISVRSSGLVENNTVNGSVAPGKARIRYFNDHPCETGAAVRIVGNAVDVDTRPNDIDISLLWSAGNGGFACTRYELLGNGDRADVEYQISPEFTAYEIIRQD